MVPALTRSAGLFASDRHAPRRRRPSDALALIAGALALPLLLWAAERGSVIDVRTASLFLSPPDWLRWLSSVAYGISFLYAAGLVIATVVRGGTARGILRDVIVAVVGVAVVGFVGEALVYGWGWPDVFPEVLDQPGQPAYPAFRVALVIAVVTVQAPHLTRPVRRIGRWMIGAVTVSTLFLGYSTVTGVVAATFAATAVVAAVRLAFGSPEGLPAEGRLRTALGGLGIDIAQLEYDARQRGFIGRALAVDADGRKLDVKVYGRDAADAQWAERVWRQIWYRRPGPSVASGRLEQVQHEALGMLLAQRAGVLTPSLRTAGVDEAGDGLLVTETLDHRMLADCTADDLHTLDLTALWSQLSLLHDEHLSHGGIGPTTVGVGDGAVSFRDFGDFTVSATEPRIQADRVALLGTTAGVVGSEPAVEAMVGVLGDRTAEEMLPYLQDGALTRPMHQWLKAREVDAAELRALVVARCDAEAPELAKLRRVTLGGIVMALFAVVAANAVISQIAEIGFDVFVDELQSASLGWVVAALVIRLGSYTTGWLSMQAMVEEPVPLGPTTLLQSAKSYVGLVVPSTIGAIAMDVRYLQKMGTPTAVAVAQGPLIGFIGFLVEVALLLLTFSSMSDAIDSDDFGTVDVGGLVLLAVGVTVVGLVVVFSIRPLRERVVPPVREALHAVRNVVVSPSRLGKVVSGELLDRIASSLSLACVVIAYGASLPFAVVVFVTVGTKLLAGIAPVPGGIGVAEALLTGLLTAAGLPAEQAFAIAITYRLVGSYLPPVLGFFTLQWLKREKYL